MYTEILTRCRRSEPARSNARSSSASTASTPSAKSAKASPSGSATAPETKISSSREARTLSAIPGIAGDATRKMPVSVIGLPPFARSEHRHREAGFLVQAQQDAPVRLEPGGGQAMGMRSGDHLIAPEPLHRAAARERARPMDGHHQVDGVGHALHRIPEASPQRDALTEVGIGAGGGSSVEVLADDPGGVLRSLEEKLSLRRSH